MAAIAPITIDDGKATPQSHTFNPIASSPPHYRENGDASLPAVGEPEIMLSLRRSTVGSSINRAKITLRIPSLEATGVAASGYEAAPAVAYFQMATVEFLLPERTTGDQRKDLRVQLANLLQNAQIGALVDDLETAY